MAVLERDGVRIFYEHHTAVNASSGAVLLSHGYSATSQMWRGQIDALTQSFDVITWDMRGHGSSDSPNDPDRYSEPHTVADMAGLLDICGADQAVIAGLSLGGYMSLAFHATHPERCSALMLFDTGPGYRSDKGRAAWNAIADKQAQALERKGLAALSQSEEVAEANHRSAKGLAHAARGMLAQVDDRVISSLSGIAVPTLVLAGVLDEPFLAPTDYMAKKIPGAQKVMLDDAGHAANIDQPETFNRAVQSFLAGLSG